MSTHQLAHGLASLGRHGDSMLVHMQPHEVAGLQHLAQQHGRSLSINPHTGLPEAFDLGGLFSAALPMAAGFALGPGGFGLMDGLTAGLAVGAGTGLLSGDPLKGVMAGMGAYGGAGLGETLAKAGASQTAGNQLMEQMKSGIAPASEQNIATAEHLINPNVSSFSPVKDTWLADEVAAGKEAAGNMAQLGNTTGGAGNLQNAMTGLKNLPTSEGWNAFKNAGGTGMQLAMAGAGPLMGGLEQSDLMGTPLAPKEDKFDPYARLNLSGDTGLRIFEAGGAVDTPESTPSTGGIEALYGTRDGTVMQNTPNDGYGIGRLNALAQGGATGYAKGGYLDGPGDGMSDSIPATIEGKQPARLADGEFVVPADVVSHLGNGSTKAGSERLYGMLDRVRKARTGSTKQGRRIDPHKLMPS